VRFGFPAGTQWRWVALWTGVIIILVLPWMSFQPHPHWARVQWVPFRSGPISVRDVVANVLLYAPWGYAYARAIRGSGANLWSVVGYALLLSITTEAAQIWSHGRFPTFTDVTCNLVGACAGAAAGHVVPRMSRPA
jgi:glycopeptide antibiotics resistance protein